MSSVQKGILALIIANVIWGFASPIFKWSLTNIPPFTLAFWRFFLASIFLGIFLASTKQLEIPTLNKKHWFKLIWYALTGITGNIIFFFLGLQRTLAINAPVIASAQPLLIFLVAPFLLNEIVTKRKLVGMIVGTIGIAVIVLEPMYYVGIDGDLIGNLFLVLATIFAVLATLTGRKLFHDQNPLVLMFWAFLIGAITFLPLATYEFGSTPALYQQLDIKGLVGIVFGSIFSSAIAYSLFAYGLSKISASESSIFTYIDPVAGTILAYFMLHEPITIPFVIGAIFIFGGIFVAEGRIHYHPFHKLRTRR
ncbi:DMT family transporter [Patescibacteria group bacterium]|nr:DMT family transporter [Patescibacteria group bacterium]